MNKIAYFGTPQFAADVLSGVLQYSEIQTLLVVSQPDKPVGRKKQIIPTPVKQIALESDIEVLQPEKIRKNQEFEKTLKNLDLDFIVVVAYGKIIPQSILDIPKHGCINLHGSLLPLYRGASPVQSALRDGLTETGLTTMYMDKKMDEGDMLLQQKVVIDPEDTSPDVFAKFTEIGPDLLHETLQKIMSGELSGVPQNHDDATYCSMIEKTEGEVSFSQDTASDIYNKFRAFQPWPGVYTYIDEKKLGLEEISLSDKLGETPGTFVKLDKKTYGVICADKKILLLHQVKPEGKKSMDIVSFVNGSKELIKLR